MEPSFTKGIGHPSSSCCTRWEK